MEFASSIVSTQIGTLVKLVRVLMLGPIVVTSRRLVYAVDVHC
jgi:uncharacterized membrane protein YadS